MNTDMRRYYDLRAGEFELVYQRDDPDRLREQSLIAESIKDCFRGLNVLEIACGTGYWTKFLAESAAKITALDGSEEMLEIAKSKNFGENIRYVKADIYRMETIETGFDGGMACFWFSHVPKARITEFLDLFHSRLKSGSTVLIVDSIHVPKYGGEIIRRAGEPDSYKLRELTNGSKHLILKNYFEKDELLSIFAPFASSIEYTCGENFWTLRYSLRK